MNSIKRRILHLALASAVAPSVWGATFGKVVPIGGHASDIALDEGRGVLYIANYTGNRVDVMSLATNTVQRSLNVAAQPASLAVSPNGRYLVIAHYAPFGENNTSPGALTVIDLETDKRQVFGFGTPPVGVAFGIDNQALIVTSSDFVLFDPVSGSTQVIAALSGMAGQALPVDKATFPPQIIRASVTASADGLRIYGAAGDEATVVIFSYNVTTHSFVPLAVRATPDVGPRVVSVSGDGSSYIVGWGLFGCDFRWHGNCQAGGPIMAQFPNPGGALNVGSHVFDSGAGLIYAQMPPKAAPPPAPTSRQVCFPDGSCVTITDPPSKETPAAAEPANLMIADADNLTVRERLRIPENLAGRSVLTADGTSMYAISDSGVMVLPVGELRRMPRLRASQEDVVFRGSFCDRRVMGQDLRVTNAGGGSASFSVRACDGSVTDKCVPVAGVSLVPGEAGTGNFRVELDPTLMQNLTGTVVHRLEVVSPDAINYPTDLTGVSPDSMVAARARLLINNREPDQRGTFVNIPGTLVDLLADPIRDRFYLLRQDRNEVLVYNAGNYNQVATLRTGNTPTQMAITFDRKYLMIGHENSQVAYVYDLDTLEQQPPIKFPLGHYPRSLAASGKAILAASRVAGPVHTIDRVDFLNRTAQAPTSLGVYKNDVHMHTVLEAAPNGSTILAAMPDGNVMLYDANSDSFSVSRKDFSSLSGTFAASNLGLYAVGDKLLNDSLVPVTTFDGNSGATSGFAFVDGGGFRMMSAKSTGMIQRVKLPAGGGVMSTRTVEPALVGYAGSEFIRTLAPLANRTSIIALTTSGFTVLPWNYDAATAPPQIDRVVNAADQKQPVAPGGLISIYGRQLSPVNIATKEMPLPTALGESCLTVNGAPVPVLFVSSTQINAQLPFFADGKVAMVLRTPGGVSDTLNLFIQPTAPSVFLSGTAGPETGLPTVFRASNNQIVTASNPVHLDDRITIYLTGMGKTSPAVEAGAPAPSNPLAQVVVPPTVTLAGVELPVAYAGLVPGQAGVYQINAVVPFRGVPLGFDMPLTITQGAYSTTLPVRVVD